MSVFTEDINLKRRERKRTNKSEVDDVKKEKNREKAQIFRQRKKEYIQHLENKVKELEERVFDLTQQLETYKSDFTAPIHGCDLKDDYELMPYEKFDLYNDVSEKYDRNSFNETNNSAEAIVCSLESLFTNEEKLIMTFSNLKVDKEREELKYLGKMTMCKKTQLISNHSFNHLERFMLESDMTPEDVENIFNKDSISQLSYAVKSVIDTILSSKQNLIELQHLSKKILREIQKSMTSSQIHKMKLYSEMLNSIWNIWDPSEISKAQTYMFDI